MNKPKVWIINKSGHDYTGAEQYGELIYLTEGKVDGFASNNHYRHFSELMQKVSPEDYILITGLASLNLIVGWIVGYKQIPLNMLLYKGDKYIVRRLMPTLISLEEGEKI